MSQGIAIVGMACRYPGARTPAELWENVLARRRAFRRLPPERLRLEDYLSDDPADPDALYATQAAVIEDWELDRVRFRVAGGTFRTADRTHWLALDVAAQALADAGFSEAEGLPRDATGVLVGNSLTGEFSRAGLLRGRWPYVRRVVGESLRQEGLEEGRIEELLGRLEERYKAPFPAPNEESLAGGLSNTIAGRICNQFDLHGGGFTVDGACASSLLAVAQACSALAAGDLDAALAGGVDLSLDPFELVGFARTGALAPGEMRVYDRRSAGFIPGEGCGFVVLMRESDAVRLGCRIYATVRGWGISSDGHGGISRPEAEGQRIAFDRAYRRAGFGIETVGYFEGHGTGTAVGDATELRALGTALAGTRRDGLPPAPIGSIKANIGHTKAAAGVAGLIKATMALHTQVLPPTTGCDDPHPEIEAQGAVRVLPRGQVWPADRPLRAAASAMGFGGINAHVVLEGTATARRRSLSPAEHALLSSAQDCELLLLDAADPAALSAKVEALLAIAPRLSRSELTDLAAELHDRLEGGAAKAAVVAATPAELAERLERLRGCLAEGLRGEMEARLEPRQGLFLSLRGQPRRIGFLFPGQGSPSHLSGGALRQRFEDLGALYELAGIDGAGGAVRDAIDTAVAQPAILTHSLAGLALLERLGVRASVAVGHSLGEIAALHWAGAFDEETAVGIARERGQAMSSLPRVGAMASLGAPPEAVEALLTASGASTEVRIAARNAPLRTVISGDAGEVERVIQRALDLGYAVTRLRVSHAFHSPLVEAAGPVLARHLEGIELRAPCLPLASTITGALLAPGADLRELLVRQVTAPVRFTEALAAARDLADLWIEVGPGRALTELAGESLDRPVLALDAGGPSLAGLLQAAGAAFALGVPLQTSVLFEGRFRRPFDPARLPSFLASPCESAPLPLQEPRPRTAPEPAPEPVPAAAERSMSALDLVRRLVAERAELPVSAVGNDSRLLSDLHLNSISVGQIAAEAARRLGLRAPASPTDYAQATVAEMARALEDQLAAGLQEAGAETPAGPPAGVDTWVRDFTVELVERPLPKTRPAAAGDGSWRIVAPPGHPLAADLASRLIGDGGAGVLLCLPEAPDDSHTALYLEAAQAVIDTGHPAREPARLVVAQQGGGGGGFTRTLHQEMPWVATRIVDVPFDHPDAASWVAAEARAAGEGHQEAVYDASGRRRVPVWRALAEAPGGPLPLGLDDVLLVTGGGKGIAAECALDLAAASGARLALLGRSRPESDPELAANLERMAAAGLTLRYLPADVTDAEAVRQAVRTAEAELGPVTAVLHGAGTNAPRRLGTLDEEAFRRTLAPKVRGLDNVLAAVDPGRLRALVTFGSIIGRAGLPGEADYATANEWLALRTERFAAAHPACRCLCLEWSVWAGVGMGERLGTLESLIREGITPIPLEVGIARLRELLSRPLPAVPVVVAGRFGEPATVEIERPDLPLLRFLEKPRVFYPGIELIVDCEISADTDPYLGDHVFRGEPLFAAVLGLEAMAQAAMALVGTAELPVFENAEFQRPVAVAPGRTTTVRVAALVREPGRVEVVLRDGSTGFAADHFRAVCSFRSRFGTVPETVAEPFSAPVLPRVAINPQDDLYGSVLFHRGRFQRVEGYRWLRATECLAEIAADGHAVWFGRYLPSDLVLGDPGARDAAIHGIQACIPHSTLLPTGVDRIVTGRIRRDEPLFLAARERSRHGDDFVYDLQILGADGQMRERWEGLRLRAVDRIAAPASWTAALLAPFAERRLQEILPESGVRISLERTEGGRRNGRSSKAVERLLGSGAALNHRPDGRPETGESTAVSVSHAGNLVLAVSGVGRIGCDLEPVAERSEKVWHDLLGERYALAELISRERGEGRDAAATRVWAASECLKKAGAPHGAPLTLEPLSGDERADGWMLLRSGGLRIGTFLGPVRELEGPAALAVAVSVEA